MSASGACHAHNTTPGVFEFPLAFIAFSPKWNCRGASSPRVDGRPAAVFGVDEQDAPVATWPIKPATWRAAPSRSARRPRQNTGIRVVRPRRSVIRHVAPTPVASSPHDHRLVPRQGGVLRWATGRADRDRYPPMFRDAMRRSSLAPRSRARPCKWRRRRAARGSPLICEPDPCPSTPGPSRRPS